MPSKKRTTKRKRTRLKPEPLLWIGVFFSVLLGLNFSPLTQARIVRVQGANDFEEAAIRSVLQQVRRLPAWRVPIQRVESRIQEIESVAAASYSQNLFGRGVLKVTSRRPVAVIGLAAEGPRVALSSDGTLYTHAGSIKAPIPELRLSPVMRVPSMGLMARWESGRIANLCEELSKFFPETQFAVEVTDRGVISLYVLGIGTRIVLGPSEGWKAKLEALSRMLSEESDLFKRNSEVNLTVPTSPMVTPASR